MKIRKCLLIIIVLTISILLAKPVFAEEISGTCGSNTTWHLDKSTGTMTISGSGPMGNDSHVPWFDHRKSITKVVIEEGVTSVGSSAFSGCSNLHTVILPSTVTEIKQSAFDSCRSLQSIALDYVTVIDDYAFRSTGLTKVTIPAGVTVINTGAFTNCTALAEVQLQNGIALIDNYAFSKCALSSVSIPDSVTEIGGSAFLGCSRLTDVKLSKNLTELGGNVFSDCKNLKKIAIPDGVTEIYGYAFSSCSSLEEVVLGAGVSTIQSTAFNGCSSLCAFTVSPDNTAYSADGGVLYNLNKTELILMPKGFQGSYTVVAGTKKIGSHSCQEVLGLTGIILPDSVTTIGDYAFCGASQLATIRLSENLQILDTYTLSRTAITEILIPASVTEIKSLVFSNCAKLQTITFVGKAPKFGDAALSSVTATIYYPGDIPGWNAATSLYGGLPKWVSTVCKEHQPVTVPATQATCTDDGLTEGSKCGICHRVLKEQMVISATGHSYAKSTMVDKENHKGICTVCGHTGTMPHNWDAGTISKMANCITAGERTYTCVSCAHTKIEEIPPTTTHTYDHGCDPQCNVCAEERDTSHDYSATYQSDAENHWYLCKICGDKKEVAPHTSGTEATEETAQTCTQCGYVIAPALGSLDESQPDVADPGAKKLDYSIVTDVLIATVALISIVVAGIVIWKKQH